MKALIAILGLASFMAGGQKGGDAEAWLTTPDKSALFERQKASLGVASPGSTNLTIEIDNGAIDLGGDGGLGQSLADGLGHLAGTGAGGDLTRGAVG